MHDPFPADASGLILKASSENFRTFSVRAVPESPASEAGIQLGDVLPAIGDESLDKYALWEVQELFQKPGAIYALSLRRGDKGFTCELKLRSLL